MGEQVATSGTADMAERITIGDVELDRAAHLMRVGGHAHTIPQQEFRLLELLMANADHVVPATVILETVWGKDFLGDPGTVAVHVLRLRKKLEQPRGANRHLRTVRGVGYIFDTDPVETE